MKKMFNYNVFNDETADSLVTTFNTLVEKSIEGKNNTPEYQAANSEFNDKLVKYCVEGIPNVIYTGIDMVRNPMINGDVFYTQRFNTVLAQAITPAVPMVASSGYSTLYDVTQVGWGDNAKYTVDSNELFIVSDAAEGVARGGVQTTYNNEYTVTASRKQISIYVDWYHVASNKQDWGKMGAKIATSFMAYIQAKAVKVMASVIAAGAKYGVSGYIANGMTDTNWLTVARNVKLANAGSEVYALGTNIALSAVLPNTTGVAGQFRYGEDSSIIKDGFLPEYKRVPLVELDNALVPNTINGTPIAILPDDMIYFIAMGAYKPLKVVFEGNNVSVAKDPLQTADHTYGMTIDMRIGIDAVVGSKFGAIDM